MRAHSPCCSVRCSSGRRGPSSSCSIGGWSMRKPEGRRGSRGSGGRWLTYALVLPLAILMIAPFLYMVATALMSEPDSLRHPVPDNFTAALVARPFGRFLLTSLIFSPARPALATLAVLAFADQWRSFVWPLVATRSSGMQPLEVGIANLEGVYHLSWSYQMAAAVAAVIPLMVLYFVAQKYFVRGIEQTAL